jgi:ABC-type Co2+ transport system permease subunit
MANRALSLAVFSAVLYLSSALFWPMPIGRWDLAVIWSGTVVAIVLGKAANRLRKRGHVSSEG